MLEEVREAVRAARGIVVLTGAGVSAESGVPTFRDRDGIWARFDPAELATPQAFRRDPGRVWQWYALRRRAVARCRPNAGHRSLAHLLLSRPDVTLVTQNVDGLHQRAIDDLLAEAVPGQVPEILELHGSLLRDRCSGCRRPPFDHHPEVDVRAGGDAEEESLLPPPCSRCGSFLRPDVVWFGEILDRKVLDRAFTAARNAELCLVAGTSAVVHPAASLPLATLESGGRLIEVNPEPSPLTPMARWSVRGPSGGVLPELLGS